MDPDDNANDNAGQPAGVAVPLGQAMPQQVERMPVLLEDQATESPAAQAPAAGPQWAGDEPGRLSKIGDGLSFNGTAELVGSLQVAGEVLGDVRVAEAASAGSVTVTESGVLVGDVRARSISVLGSTEGLLDAGGGKVTLHSSARVAGRIRYTHLQVNGADLNAQLERVRPDDDRGTR